MIKLNLLVFALAFAVAKAAEIGKPSAGHGDEFERIVGGREANEGEFPYAVALYYRGDFMCTASIISPNIILTAAHCVLVRRNERPKASDFYAVAGSVDRTADNAMRITFSDVTPHPEYNSRNISNDVAFFRTSSPIQMSSRVQPVALARSNTTLDEYNNATAMGWGLTRRGYPNRMNAVRQTLMKHKYCKLRYGSQVSEKQLCSDGYGTGVCSGDSGGPLTRLSADPPLQLGIASFVRFPGCGSLIISPAVFARVSAYVDWIIETSQDREIQTR